ncbi:MAG TPA: GNAT family N-acetyltransferase, partial [Rhodocyclaceae bacterium]|nr:GNAT family N-acetyltransferase [Rhodocyclaceae bacterium]
GQPLKAYTRAHLAATLRTRPGALTLLALKRDEHGEESYVGLLNAFEGFSTFACQPLLNIHDVVVTESERGQGIGRQLMQAAEELARELGCCKLTLEVLQGNTKAQAVYRSLGYAGYELKPEMGQALFWQKKL